MPDTLDEILDTLKDEHALDVRALQAKVAEADGIAELSSRLNDVLSNTGVLKLSNGETANAEDLVLAVGQLVDDKAELSSRIDSLEEASKRAAAEAEVDALITGGFVSESTRDAFVKVRLSQSEEDFKALIPEQPIIKLQQCLSLALPLVQADAS